MKANKVTKTGIELIAEERQRQIEVEGYNDLHDSHHVSDELAIAAAIYAMPERYRFDSQIINKWPWGWKYYKPCPDDRIRELVKAGALIAAEIDRMQSDINLTLKTK